MEAERAGWSSRWILPSPEARPAGRLTECAGAEILDCFWAGPRANAERMPAQWAMAAASDADSEDRPSPARATVSTAHLRAGGTSRAPEHAEAPRQEHGCSRCLTGCGRSLRKDDVIKPTNGIPRINRSRLRMRGRAAEVGRGPADYSPASSLVLASTVPPWTLIFDMMAAEILSAISGFSRSVCFAASRP